MRRVIFTVGTLILFFANFIYLMLYFTLPLSMTEATCHVVTQTSPGGKFHTLSYNGILSTTACFEPYHSDECQAYANTTVSCYTYIKSYHAPVAFLTRREAMCYYFSICFGLGIYGDVLAVLNTLCLCLVMTVATIHTLNHFIKPIPYERLEQIEL